MEPSLVSLAIVVALPRLLMTQPKPASAIDRAERRAHLAFFALRSVNGRSRKTFHDFFNYFFKPPCTGEFTS